MGSCLKELQVIGTWKIFKYMAMKDSIKLFLLKNPLISDTRIKQQHIRWTIVGLIKLKIIQILNVFPAPRVVLNWL